MRTLIVCLAFATGLLGTLALMGQDKKAPPTKLTFVTKNGNVTFDHSAHVMREKGDCAACHPKLFMQDAKAPLNFKANLHKTAEADKTSCGACHNAGGPSFETKGNCAKCHMKG
jgi:c(7)-type cytochrome triheme protein